MKTKLFAEDTITLFTGPGFTGEFKTIIENFQNFTANEVSGYTSLLVTGIFLILQQLEPVLIVILIKYCIFGAR